ncbi:MAG: VWA domain-containing protein [Planctomycetota bacterium]
MAAASTAQQPKPTPPNAGTPNAKVAEGQGQTLPAALSRWQEVGDKKGPQRIAALRALGAFDDLRVTDILLGQLRASGGDWSSNQIVEVIGQRPRASALEPLLDLIEKKETQPALRTAACRAVGKQGSRGIDALIAIAADESGTKSDDVRLAAMNGLSASGEERAWRGLAPLALRGNSTQQLVVLRLLAPAKDQKAVTQVRVRLLQESDDVLAAAAWRQLAAERYAKTQNALDDLIARMGQSPPPAARVELIHGLVHGMAPSVFEDFLRLAGDPAPLVQGAVSATAAEFAKDGKLVRWLLTEAIDRATEPERQVVLAIVSKAKVEHVAPMVAKIRAGLQKPTREAVELAIATLPSLQEDPTFVQDLLRMVEDKDPQLRTTGLTLLLDLGIGTAVAVAQKHLDAKEWELRSVSYRYLTKFRELSSIPLLIERFGKEDGRLLAELSEALFVHAGVRCWSRGEWDDWWQKSATGHALPAWESVRSQKQGSTGGGSTAAYYGIPMVSKRSVFLIDTSGSMNAPIGTDKKRTRLDEVKKQLYAAVEKLPEDQLFNIYFYAGGVNPMWPQVQKAAGPDRKAVLERIEKLQIGVGGTNIFDSIDRAFADVEVDTIYLLSDGDPSAGRITDPAQIADQVRRWNYSRQMVIHCVAVGSRSPMLERLAKESSGTYVFVQ